MCGCKGNIQNTTTNITNQSKPDVSNGCSTPLSFLNYLNNLINLNVSNSNVTKEDKYQLQIYKGQVLSGINLTNYCYTDYNVVETNIYNVISKYT